MPNPITSALESKPDIPDGSATGFLGTPARKTATWRGYWIWNSSIRWQKPGSNSRPFQQLMKTQSFHRWLQACDRETQVELSKRLPVERWQRSKEWVQSR